MLFLSGNTRCLLQLKNYIIARQLRFNATVTSVSPWLHQMNTDMKILLIFSMQMSKNKDLKQKYLNILFHGEFLLYT